MHFTHIFYIFILLLLSYPSVAFSQEAAKTANDLKAFEIEVLNAVDQLEYNEEATPRKILLFSKTNKFRHKSIPFGLLSLKIMGEKTGLYTATISNDLKYFEPENISTFDAICFLNTTGELFSPHQKAKLTPEQTLEWVKKEKRLKTSMMNYLKGGKGFIGIHSATDTFYKWPEYGEMIGAYFDGHPWTSKTTVTLTVPENQKENALVSFLTTDDLSFKEEIYQFREPQIKGDAQVLLKLDPHKNSFKKAKRPNEKNVPISWTKNHHQGRVFYSSIGHNNNMYSNPKVLQHYLNGIIWALGEQKK